jgi:poly(3-hydroxybutyrate) depolymerase
VATAEQGAHSASGAGASGASPGRAGAAGVTVAGARALLSSGAGASLPVAGVPGSVGAAGSAAAGGADATPVAGAGAAVPSAGAVAAGSGPNNGANGITRVDPQASAGALAALISHLGQPRASRPELTAQAFASVALSKADAQAARKALWDDFAKLVRETRADEVGATETAARTVRIEGVEHVLRYYMARRGTAPATGYSLFISMHGGGNTAAATNDSQWENQIALVDGYDPKDALWVAPRAPIDDWNMWFIDDIDPLFERLITDLIVFENVDPNKVYINGYSAGGDGVYQLGPRMAERWAGAGMSAGHPNASSPLSLRDVAFAIHVGGNDTGYDRNKKAAEWGMRLDMLAMTDPGGYVTQWQVHAGKPHWMDLEDAVSIPFLQQHTRNPYPSKVVWEQAEVTRAQSYWLAVDDANRAKGNELRAQYDAQGIHITAAKGVKRVSIRLTDEMLDLDAPVVIDFASQPLQHASIVRSIATLQKTLLACADPALMFSAEVTLDLP